ncbi:hypothetical protein [Hymenobacter sp. PAMC 26628]|uniref:hypothetical protein n=1 Tax=Hymenobacter sp. PAMC 26628 TaxID=1484118 RepID=UPI0012FF7935|nr:hypothetical protein [Hymenobacter sp. PAMC 26628]
MKYSLLALLALGLTIGRAHAQERPVLGAPPVVLPAPTAPAPARPVEPSPTAPEIPIYTAPGTQPAVQPQTQPPVTIEPSNTSPSGLELPGREQARKAAQAHAEQYTKFFIYSGFGLSYGSNYYTPGGVFSISASPALGYRINDRVSVGPGISYSYTNQTFGGGNPSLSLNNIGVKVFAQIRVINQFFIHGEYEVTKAQLPLVDANNNYIISNNQFVTGSRTVESPLAGVGYRSQISNRAAADLVVLYNFNDTFNNSIYSNPVIRFNFLFNIGK